MHKDPRPGFKDRIVYRARLGVFAKPFGVDGEKAIEIARLITSSRRAEAVKENNYLYAGTGEG